MKIFPGGPSFCFGVFLSRGAEVSEVIFLPKKLKPFFARELLDGKFLILFAKGGGGKQNFFPGLFFLGPTVFKPFIFVFWAFIGFWPLSAPPQKHNVQK